MATVTFKGTPIRVNGDLPAVGKQAPDFRLVQTDLSELTLSELKGNKVVLNIFPSSDTGVCATSIRTFNKKATEHLDTVVLCISKDLPFAHSRFCSAEGIENVKPLSAFRDTAFEKDYGLLIAEGPLKGLLARAVVVIDATGKILYTELVPEIAQEPNYDQALAALK